MIRVIHHMAQVNDVMAQVRHVLVPEATFILEHANKRNVKAMLRYGLRRQQWNPYSQEPTEFVALNYDFHPVYIKRHLETNQFTVEKRIPVSYLRLGILKRTLPIGLLVGLDRALQHTGLLYSPSVWVKARATGSTPNQIEADSIFACPESGDPLERHGDEMVCTGCGLRYAVREGIYDFKAPVGTA